MECDQYNEILQSGCEYQNYLKLLKTISEETFKLLVVPMVGGHFELTIAVICEEECQLREGFDSWLHDNKLEETRKIFILMKRATSTLT